MNIAEREDLLQGVREVATRAGSYIHKESLIFDYSKSEVKGLNDLVSHVDRETEKLVVKELEKLYSGAGFLVEENTASSKKEYNWIVDPLDGTTNFVHGIPCYAVSIGLEHQGEMVLGAVYEVAREECFSALQNHGAWMNGKSITVSSRKNLGESLIATGFPIYNFTHQDNYLLVLKELMQKTQGIRRIGSAASDLCYLACGRVDAFFEYNLHPWDVSAGGLIAKEAGAVVSDFNGGSNWLFGREICAANPMVFEDFFGMVHRHLGKT